MCRHQLAPLVAQKGKKIVPVALLRVCLKCGTLKVGIHTIRISKDRLDMDSKPIKNAGKVLIVNNGRLKVPVGANLYN